MELTTKTAKRLYTLINVKHPEFYEENPIKEIISFKNELKEIIQKIAKDKNNKYGITEILNLIQEIEEVEKQ